MLKSTEHGFVPISVPGDVGSGDVGSGVVNVSVSVSFRQFTNEMPVRIEERGGISLWTLFAEAKAKLPHSGTCLVMRLASKSRAAWWPRNSRTIAVLNGSESCNQKRCASWKMPRYLWFSGW